MHIVYVLVSVFAWLAGAALVVVAVAAPASSAIRLAKYAVATAFMLRFRGEEWRAWQARAILGGAGALLLLTGGAIYLLPV